MKNLNKIVMGLFAMAVLSSCGPKVTTTKTSDADLSQYETFAYLPNGNFEDPSKGMTTQCWRSGHQRCKPEHERIRI